MGNRDIKRLSDLAKRKGKKKRTKEQAIAALVSAGIFTKDGEYTKPYQELSRVGKK